MNKSIDDIDDAFVQLEGVSVDYPIYNSNAKSLRTALLQPLLKVFGVDVPEHRKKLIPALKNIDLKINTGDKIALLGSNGAGKSTLLRILAGIISPSNGVYRSQGTIRALLELGQGIDADGSGWDNILLLGMLLGRPLDEIRAKSKEIGEFSDLGDSLDLPVGSYSSGMMLRLTFSALTAFETDILLLDEVIGVGDLNFQQKAKLRLENLIESSSILVLATHSPDISRAICDTGIIIDEGKILHRLPIDEAIDVHLEMMEYKGEQESER